MLDRSFFTSPVIPGLIDCCVGYVELVGLYVMLGVVVWYLCRCALSALSCKISEAFSGGFEGRIKVLLLKEFRGKQYNCEV